MSAMAPQITSLTTAYLAVYLQADQRKHQFGGVGWGVGGGGGGGGWGVGGGGWGGGGGGGGD